MKGCSEADSPRSSRRDPPPVRAQRLDVHLGSNRRKSAGHPLGTIERVSACLRARRIVAVRRRDGDPMLLPDADVMPLHLHRLAQRFRIRSPAGPRLRRFARRSGSSRIRRAQPRHHCRRRRNAAAGRRRPASNASPAMTVRVVDLLEAIEIDAEDGTLLSRSGAASACSMPSRTKPVGKTGQGVMPGMWAMRCSARTAR